MDFALEIQILLTKVQKFKDQLELQYWSKLTIDNLLDSNFFKKKFRRQIKLLIM